MSTSLRCLSVPKTLKPKSISSHVAKICVVFPLLRTRNLILFTSHHTIDLKRVVYRNDENQASLVVSSLALSKKGLLSWINIIMNLIFRSIISSFSFMNFLAHHISRFLFRTLMPITWRFHRIILSEAYIYIYKILYVS